MRPSRLPVRALSIVVRARGTRRSFLSTAAIAASLPKSRFVKQNRSAEDPDLVAIADCIRQCVDDAGLSYDPQANDIGLIVTHESPGLAPHVQSFFRWGKTAKAWLRSA